MELEGEMFTTVGGLSMILEVDLGHGEEVLYKDMMLNDDIGDCGSLISPWGPGTQVDIALHDISATTPSPSPAPPCLLDKTVHSLDPCSPPQSSALPCPPDPLSGIEFSATDMMLNSKEINFEQHMHGKVPVDIHVVEMLLGSTSIAMDRSEMLRFGMLQGLVFILEGERVLWCSRCRQNISSAYTKCSNAGYGILEEQKLLMAQNEGILFSAHHVYHNVLAWRRNVFSPYHSTTHNDHLSLENFQTWIQSAFSADKSLTGGDNQVVGKISSWKQNDPCPRNSSVQKCQAKWFSFEAKRNWDPGILSCILIHGTSMIIVFKALRRFKAIGWRLNA
jgi:hypothetical protein